MKYVIPVIGLILAILGVILAVLEGFIASWPYSLYFAIIVFIIGIVLLIAIFKEKKDDTKET